MLAFFSCHNFCCCYIPSSRYETRSARTSVTSLFRISMISRLGLIPLLRLAPYVPVFPRALYIGFFLTFVCVSQRSRVSRILILLLSSVNVTRIHSIFLALSRLPVISHRSFVLFHASGTTGTIHRGIYLPLAKHADMKPLIPFLSIFVFCIRLPDYISTSRECSASVVVSLDALPLVAPLISVFP